MKSAKYEKLKWQAGVVEEETALKLKIVDDHNKMQKLRATKRNHDQVSFIKRKPIFSRSIIAPDL